MTYVVPSAEKPAVGTSKTPVENGTGRSTDARLHLPSGPVTKLRRSPSSGVSSVDHAIESPSPASGQVSPKRNHSREPSWNDAPRSVPTRPNLDSVRFRAGVDSRPGARSHSPVSW